jgi:acyl transferase domain-containing protein
MATPFELSSRARLVNNDGSEKAGYTGASVNSQADAVVEALAKPAVDADSISYVEAHGSGTPVGDPIEIRASDQSLPHEHAAVGLLRHGSAKTNIGHLDAAAAVAGMIKTVLALEHRKLPPSLHFSEVNPEIDFPSSPFYVNTQLREWTSDGPRRAGVMSTGMGGTNAHVVLEEAPEPDASTSPGAPTFADSVGQD